MEDCFWCRRNLGIPIDADTIKKFDKALRSGDQMLFESAMEDLMHALYHKARRSLDHADAMDVVLDAMKTLWGWWNRNQGSGNA